MSIEVRSNMHFVFCRYCCESRYSVNIRMKNEEFDHDWRVESGHPVLIV